MVLVANCGEVIPPFIRLGAGIRPDDGLLDVVVCGPNSFGQSVRAVWDLLCGSPGAENGRHWSAMPAGGRSGCGRRRSEPVQLDGEPDGHTPSRRRWCRGRSGRGARLTIRLQNHNCEPQRHGVTEGPQRKATLDVGLVVRAVPLWFAVPVPRSSPAVPFLQLVLVCGYTRLSKGKHSLPRPVRWPGRAKMADSVLLIDDDVDVLRGIGNYFERLGYEVTRELSGEAGPRHLRPAASRRRGARPAAARHGRDSRCWSTSGSATPPSFS